MTTYTLGALPPVPARLTAAVAAAPRVPDTSRYTDPGATRPDFAAMFATPAHVGPIVAGECFAGYDDGCPGCEHLVTPRLAWLMCTAAELLVDEWRYDAVADPEWFASYVKDDLPPVAVAYASTHDGWLASFLAAVRDLGLMVAAGQQPLPNSTAEEMALHLLLDRTEAFLGMLGDDPDAEPWETFEDLPTDALTGEHQDDLAYALGDRLEILKELLFEDHDVLMLFDRGLDGIESDTGLGGSLGTVNLHPRDWFEPFRDLAETSPFPATEQGHP